MAELADAPDSKSGILWMCRFESDLGYRQWRWVGGIRPLLLLNAGVRSDTGGAALLARRESELGSELSLHSGPSRWHRSGGLRRLKEVRRTDRSCVSIFGKCAFGFASTRKQAGIGGAACPLQRAATCCCISSWSSLGFSSGSWPLRLLSMCSRSSRHSGLSRRWSSKRLLDSPNAFS